MADDEAPKIQIDSDWKEQARAEKERLAKEAKEAPSGGARAPGQMPPASIETLISTLATQALLFLGAIAEPRSGQRMVDLDLARHHIDMLGVIEEKTRGNLTDEESKMLSSTIYELRSRYIQTGSGGSSR